MNIITRCRYQLEGYAETLIWDIDVMKRHLQKLEIGTEGREAIGNSRQQLMDHAGRRVPDISNWRRRCALEHVLLGNRNLVNAIEFSSWCRYEHERDRRLLVQKKIEELNTFLKQCVAPDTSPSVTIAARASRLRRYMESSDDDDDELAPTMPQLSEKAAEPPPPLGPRYRPAEALPSFMKKV